MSTTFKDLNSGKAHRALTKDIGGNGVCLVTEDEMATGTPLAVQITLPDRPAPIAFLGDVVWSILLMEASQYSARPPVETGIRFVSIDPKDRALIKQFARLNALPTL